MIQPEQKQIKKKEKNYKKFYLNFDAAVSNNLLALESATKYLNSNIKVNGLKGKLGDSVKVGATDKGDKQKNTILVQVDNKMNFSKRYLKYLVKKFLKRENIDKKIIRKYRKFIQKSVKGKVNSEVILNFIKGNIIPPFKIDDIEFKSINTNYIIWLFSHEEMHFWYSEFHEEFLDKLVNILTSKYNVNEEDEIELLKCYIINLNKIYHSVDTS